MKHMETYVNSKLFIQCSESTGSTIVADATSSDELTTLEYKLGFQDLYLNI